MAHEILVPMDGSPLSRRALDVAVTENPDADITVLHVIDPSTPADSYAPIDSTTAYGTGPRHGSDEWYERAEEFADELFADAEDLGREHGTAVETVLATGDPARVIVDVADDRGVDHVIIGSHGRDEDARILLGSVTESVAYRSPARARRRSSCPARQ